MHYPLLPVCPAGDPEPAQAEEWFRERLRRHTEDYLKAHGYVYEFALRAPRPGAGDRHARSYCPRCLSEYELTRGTCYQCGDRPLMPLLQTAQPIIQA
jgi:hypothetical protein